MNFMPGFTLGLTTFTATVRASLRSTSSRLICLRRCLSIRSLTFCMHSLEDGMRKSYLVALLLCAGFWGTRSAHAQSSTTQTYKDCTITYNIGGSGLFAIATVQVSCSQTHQLTATVTLNGGPSETNSTDGTSVSAAASAETDGYADATYSVTIDGVSLGTSLSE
jgi:hypothetical protein